ncbi:heavy-metal transporting ATPase [Spiroplasma syrphidicola EA-1]|uniref:Heavy-metal transporting ATPase n=1 Tax=Spiroplasma syrphidicola EA-1 TaxID=1276229 RepID=R4UE32_9MOLU|nr:heavy-metal-associated domain-containing protein [Spiroplasma syrphidicola]AGM26144.1 heavy-metal transporting ATPase [Spiroplasma syrphidicola EA-1]
MMTLKLYVPELNCSSCANAIEKKLQKIVAIKLLIGVATKTVTITFNPNEISKDDILAKMKKTGFDYDELSAEMV